jgi:hypothetical protein
MAQAPPAPTLPRPTPVKPIPPPLNSPEGRAAAEAKAQAGAPPPPKPLPRWRRGFRAVVPWLSVLFLCGLVVQVFFAGYGLMELGGQGMEWHLGFAHVIELVPLLLILCGFLGADRFGGSVGIVLLVLFQLQYLFIGLEDAPPTVRALHPTNAAVMIAVTMWLVLRRPIWHGRSI